MRKGELEKGKLVFNGVEWAVIIEPPKNGKVKVRIPVSSELMNIYEVWKEEDILIAWEFG